MKPSVYQVFQQSPLKEQLKRFIPNINVNNKTYIYSKITPYGEFNIFINKDLTSDTLLVSDNELQRLILKGEVL